MSRTDTDGVPDDAPFKIPMAFKPLFKPARYKAYWGGRGSAKTRSMAAALVAHAFNHKEIILCAREVQESLKDSSKKVIENTIRQMGLGDHFTSIKDEIRGPHGSIFMFDGLRDHTVDSLKSKEGITKCWIEEAQSITKNSLQILIPTIRDKGSEIWASWNPEDETDAIDYMFRGPHPPGNSVIRQVSFRDNPFFKDTELPEEMARDWKLNPEDAEWIWEGGYKPAPSGSYYGSLLAAAQKQGRMGWVPHDPSLPVHCSFDLGKGQHFVVWFCQWVGRECRWIDYLEGNQEAADEGLTWYGRKLREKPYTYAPLLLPHDGAVTQYILGKSAQDVFEGLQFKVDIVPDIGVNNGIQALKRLIPMSWFDIEKCSVGLKHLRMHRENLHERGHSLGPLKDAHIHCADSARYMGVAYDAPPLSLNVNMDGDQPIGDYRVNY